MPSSMARDREDQVLHLVCAALSDCQRSVTIATRPDREPPGDHTVTVDALLNVIAETRYIR